MVSAPTFNFVVEDFESHGSPSEADSLFGVLSENIPLNWEGKVRLLAELIVHLDEQVIAEAIRLKPSLQRKCPTCGTENQAMCLDEAKILLPFPKGSFQGRTDLKSHIYLRGGNNGFYSHRTGPRAETGRYATYTNYMLVQDLMRSGLFTETQLRGADGRFSPLFSRHDLEVNAKAFKAVRPIACLTCRSIPLSGLSAHWRSLYPSGGTPSQTQGLADTPTVDDSFSKGEKVRTGFRIRSKSALRRRRYKHLQGTRYRYNFSQLKEIGSTEVNIQYFPKSTDLKWVPLERNRRATRWQFQRWYQNQQYIRVYPKCLPRKHHTKYWYFLRKNKRFFLSSHNPHGDDHLSYDRYCE